MKHFTLEPGMRSSIGGAFYPTGYSMVMFPSAEDADRIGHRLIEKGMSGDEVYLLPAQTVLAEIAPTAKTSDNPLPSAGTDAATVRAYTELARDGHTGLLVRTRDGAAAERLMELVRTVPYSIAQRYRTLVIEDL
ncbi:MULTISPECIES: hypothetical protein [Variovorax]|jgi:hypothetical protein|uniref:hypothetical protein n=1 Tax=Variovorax TaxID=34072 RepID=UPI0008973A8D|nr:MULTISPECIES: hypothetical protein [Variovorax]MDQ0081065.1 hypothetical protein [Variovorax boronicumulans]SDX08593.1 hypothetical protein SAMN05518669_103257 [Variovorax sp. YR634]SDZ43813.1 hypothetical protein SAMN05518854_106101 [Variovorax sp. YR266]SEU11767.1 hypothetical protein SAMN05443580_11636 [Variovorax sp. OV084]SOD28888.1 hypothetical protein SAMN05518800_4478 [Variovorax sp. YR752]